MRACRPCSPVPWTASAPPVPSSATVATSVRPCSTTSTVRRDAWACLIALESASETRNQIVVSTTSGRRRSGSATISTGSGDWTPSAARAPGRPRSRPTGCRPRASSRSSRPASDACSRAEARRCCAPSGSCSSCAEREVDRLAEDDEPLLRAVVQVAPDPAALLVGGVHGAGAAGDDLVRAGAQCALVAAAVQLGGGAGGEDLQRVQLARRGVQGAERDQPDVPDRAAVGAAQGDREIAVAAVGVEEAVGGVAQPGAAAHEQQVGLVGVLAGRAGERELVALAQRHARLVRGGDRARVAGTVLDQLGHEGDLGVQRALELLHEPAQEGGADDARGPCGEAAQQVALADLGGGGGHGTFASVTGPSGPGQWCCHTAGYGYLPLWPTIASRRRSYAATTTRWARPVPYWSCSATTRTPRPPPATAA